MVAVFRVMSKLSAFMNSLPSRLAEAKSIIPRAPFGIEIPKNSNYQWLYN
jgi:hypothetical protein